LLDDTSATLRELNEVLLRDSHTLVSLLEDIRELSAARGATEAEEVCHRLSEQLDRIAAWGAARQNAWSEYYQYVHRYLRDVVRLDPTRALTQRLRAQLSGRAGRSFSLVVATTPALVVPRPVEPPAEKPPVKRPRAERERPLAEPVADDREALLEARVEGALAEGASSLSQVTERVVRELPEAERFATAGQVAELASRLSKAEAARERPWVAVEEGMLIEEWTLHRPEEKS
jgi:chromosome partition protein MukF